MGLLEMLFSHPGFFCVIAESGRRVVGSNCLDERSTIPGVGPVTIAPEVQDRGIGRILMQAVIDRVPGADCGSGWFWRARHPGSHTQFGTVPLVP